MINEYISDLLTYAKIHLGMKEEDGVYLSNRILEKLGVSEMCAAGEAFNPELHNAVSHIDDENAAENVVAQVYQKGYKIGDKVVRHATVVVAN